MKFLKKIIYSFIQKRRKSKLGRCGQNTFLSRGVYSGNIEIGSSVSIGTGAWFVSRNAKIIINDNVVIAPNVTIYTGDHVTNMLGKHICEITEQDKAESPDVWDKDVVIESGCWIGTRAVILKGVTVGRGSIIGAGAVVTRDVPPYSVYVGVPACRTFARFNEEQVAEHEKLLQQRGVKSNSFTE